MLGAAADAGINVLDSAAMYGDAEQILGRPPLEWHPKTLQRNIEESLRRLKTDHVDLIQPHSCSEELLKRGDVIRTLQRAQDAGKVRYIGYSGDGAAAPEEWLRGPLSKPNPKNNLSD